MGTDIPPPSGILVKIKVSQAVAYGSNQSLILSSRPRDSCAYRKYGIKIRLSVIRAILLSCFIDIFFSKLLKVSGYFGLTKRIFCFYRLPVHL
jgi:hypothetical protein